MVWPPSDQIDSPSSASSWRLVLPVIIAPACFSSLTGGVPTVGIKLFRARQPAVVFNGMLSFNSRDTPEASGHVSH
jgi:hypothetical protein